MDNSLYELPSDWEPGQALAFVRRPEALSLPELNGLKSDTSLKLMSLHRPWDETWRRLHKHLMGLAPSETSRKNEIQGQPMDDYQKWIAQTVSDMFDIPDDVAAWTVVQASKTVEEVGTENNTDHVQSECRDYFLSSFFCRYYSLSYCSPDPVRSGYCRHDTSCQCNYQAEHP